MEREPGTEVHEERKTALPKVLVVEDREINWSLYAVNLRQKAEVLIATSLEEGERLFEKNPDVALVVMDACVPGTKPNSMPLVRKIRETFKGHIIAASSDPENWPLLMAAGCNHAAEKHEVPEVVTRLLKLR